jgi:diacylglycerol kinase family enzyme
MSGSQRQIEVIVNARSGAPGKESVAGRVTEHLSSTGHAVRVALVRTAGELHAAIGRAVAGPADTVVAGGGDGTVSAVAAAVLETPKALGVLPLGTFNFFARRIGVPLDLDGALDVLGAAPPPWGVAVGEVNGRIFINNSSVGLYPAVVRQREAAYRRFGRSRVAAYLSAGTVLLRPPGLLSLELTVDGNPLDRRTPLLFVGVNPQQLATFEIPGYECVEDGRLAAYVTRPVPPAHLWRLGVQGLLRNLRGAEELEVICGSELLVGVRRKRIRVALDGEVARLHAPLRYRIRPAALRVVSFGPGETGAG